MKTAKLTISDIEELSNESGPYAWQVIGRVGVQDGASTSLFLRFVQPSTPVGSSQTVLSFNEDGSELFEDDALLTEIESTCLVILERVWEARWRAQVEVVEGIQAEVFDLPS